MIALCGQLVSIFKTQNNCVHYGHDNDNDNSYNERYLSLIFCCKIYLSMDNTFRHILAILHFNENLHRDTQLTKDGKKYFKVTYPKYKLGEEVVREVASPPTYCEFNYSIVNNYFSAVIVQPGVIHCFLYFFVVIFLKSKKVRF